MSEAGPPALFEDEKRSPRGRHVDASTLKPDSFVISGTQGLKYFVVRAEADAGMVRGITILYDQATVGIMAPVAIAMANSFVGFPASAPPPGTVRAVEYGTAVVANGRGDLVTSAAMTAGCTAIAVPGFGYAAQLETDPTREVALLRLYGARDLVPAGLAAEPRAESRDLILLGVADPLVQNGGDAVTKTTARLDRNVIIPVPQPGFSGAAAIDAQGRSSALSTSSPQPGPSPPSRKPSWWAPAACVLFWPRTVSQRAPLAAPPSDRFCVSSACAMSVTLGKERPAILPPCYRFLNFGARFSMNACIPSLRSSVANSA